ncbi:hypothetical protein H257_18210 [Aphanomyces astaci]|uniref:Uncharacterized protein n=1 Tax=Aphanomyces astaci TaxID=112090 RepID=W4FDR9_APHAT|nr:hypothetical protein H257_18210 [Aphanomyces astaci]ETV64981.1 hypothetical protein H257_18210 [Aphanomyces astaci]|eukprot:XP_009845531.1 hypothetical protein H257_18210 [Aphanomyces astaci]
MAAFSRLLLSIGNGTQMAFQVDVGWFLHTQALAVGKAEYTLHQRFALVCFGGPMSLP